MTTTDFATAKAVVLLYLAFVIPMRVGFDYRVSGALYVCDFFLDVYFWVDIALNFVLAYENAEGVAVYDLGKIRRHYLRTWFALDVVASFPVDMILDIADSKFVCSMSDSCEIVDGNNNDARMIRLFKIVRVLRLMKTLRLVRAVRILDRLQDELFMVMGYIKILKLVAILVFLGHIFGCFFYFFSTEDWRSDREIQRLSEGSWLEANDVAPKSGATLAEKYVVASYW